MDFPQQYELQKRCMLRKWKSRKGYDATYQKLVDIFTELGQIAVADRIREVFVGKRNTDEARVMQPQTSSGVEPESAKIGVS